MFVFQSSLISTREGVGQEEFPSSRSLCAISSGERDSQKHDLATALGHVVADTLSVPLRRVGLHPLNTTGEGLLADVVDLLAERFLGVDVLAVDAAVVLWSWLASKPLESRGVE